MIDPRNMAMPGPEVNAGLSDRQWSSGPARPPSLPQQPYERSNPVFSICQTDVICYGTDLEDWIARERSGWSAKPWRRIKEIRFWSEALRKNGAEP